MSTATATAAPVPARRRTSSAPDAQTINLHQLFMAALISIVPLLLVYEGLSGGAR